MNPNPAKFAALLSLFVSFAGATEEAPAALPAIQFTEVARKVIDFGDHTVTMIRVRPPVFPKAPPPPPPPEPTAEEIATAERLAQKEYRTIAITGTVYLGASPSGHITELTWWSDDHTRQYKAFSNIDFQYLTQLTNLETPDAVYLWFPFITAYSAEFVRESETPIIPAHVTFSGTEPEYLFEGTDTDAATTAATLDALDHILAHFQLNKASLIEAHNQREFTNAERARQLRENPPKTPDTTIHFWPIKSRLNH